MFRYIAIAWATNHPDQVSVSKQICLRLSADPVWRCALEQPGVRVYVADAKVRTADVHLLPGGVVLGTLFRHPSRAGRSVQSGLDEQERARIVASGGRELINGFWGNYVAIVSTAPDQAFVLRGPASSLPCFHVQHRSVNVFFSLVEDCAGLGLLGRGFDWDYLAVQLFAAVPSTDRTALLGVRQIQPGECAEVRHGRALAHVYWDAHEIAFKRCIEDVRDAGALLHDMVRACVQAWGSRHAELVLNLSGGLDSAIVLASLRNGTVRPRVHCVNEYTVGTADGDEREYSRRAADHIGCDSYLEVERSVDVNLEAMMDARLSPVPQGVYRRVDVSRPQARIASDFGASAIFTGGGGDQLLGRNSGANSPADYVYHNGFRMKVIPLAYASAQLEGVSIWRTLDRAVRRGLFHHQHNLWERKLDYRPIVGRGVLHRLQERNALGTPWLLSTRQLPPGKLTHIASLAIPYSYYDPLGQDGDAVLIAPLFSQPAIEVALQIPTWVLMHGGRDRGLARHEFRDLLPVEILKRRSKAGIEEHKFEIFRRNLPFVQALLIDGVLVREGLLERPKIIDALSRRPSALKECMVEVYRLIDTEVWLRSWERQAFRAAA